MNTLLSQLQEIRAVKKEDNSAEADTLWSAFWAAIVREALEESNADDAQKLSDTIDRLGELGELKDSPDPMKIIEHWVGEVRKALLAEQKNMHARDLKALSIQARTEWKQFNADADAENDRFRRRRGLIENAMASRPHADSLAESAEHVLHVRPFATEKVDGVVRIKLTKTQREKVEAQGAEWYDELNEKIKLHSPRFVNVESPDAMDKLIAALKSRREVLQAQFDLIDAIVNASTEDRLPVDGTGYASRWNRLCRDASINPTVEVQTQDGKTTVRFTEASQLESFKKRLSIRIIPDVTAELARIDSVNSANKKPTAKTTKAKA